MKWGISRSKEVRGVKKAYKDQRRSDREKYNDFHDNRRKADNNYKKDLAAAREKAANRLFKDGDEARNKRIANLSLGKALTQTFLMGSYGAKKYNQYRAAGETKGKSAVKGLGWNIANNLGYQLPTTVSNAQFVKNYVNDRRKNKRK